MYHDIKEIVGRIEKNEEFFVFIGEFPSLLKRNNWIYLCACLFGEASKEDVFKLYKFISDNETNINELINKN